MPEKKEERTYDAHVCLCLRLAQGLGRMLVVEVKQFFPGTPQHQAQRFTDDGIDPLWVVFGSAEGPSQEIACASAWGYFDVNAPRSLLVVAGRARRTWEAVSVEMEGLYYGAPRAGWRLTVDDETKAELREAAQTALRAIQDVHDMLDDLDDADAEDWRDSCDLSAEGMENLACDLGFGVVNGILVPR